MAIHISKVYTRSGDKGDTSLVGNVRLSKGSLKIETYGTIDELNSCVGLVRSWLDREKHSLDKGDTEKLLKLLQKIQNELFDVGSILATPEDQSYPSMPTISEEQITCLESTMDTLQEDLPALKSFTLPGGTMLNAYFHQCRTVARRAEREIVRLGEQETLYPNVLGYVNRLSDLFFVLSRYVAKQEGVGEYLWEHGLSKSS
jgi:cob(I)alamin adenosyltransferase